MPEKFPHLPHVETFDVQAGPSDAHSVLRVLAHALQAAANPPPGATDFALSFPLCLDLASAGALLDSLLQRDAQAMH